MTTPQITPGQAGRIVPVACTLTPADLAAQAGRWQRLMARAMTERAETADGLRMSSRREPGTEEELRRLVAVESECCAWADWAVDMNAGNLMLEVRSAGTGIATLHGMFR
jgi:hypothetical protein